MGYSKSQWANPLILRVQTYDCALASSPTWRFIQKPIPMVDTVELSWKIRLNHPPVCVCVCLDPLQKWVFGPHIWGEFPFLGWSRCVFGPVVPKRSWGVSGHAGRALQPRPKEVLMFWNLSQIHRWVGETCNINKVRLELGFEPLLVEGRWETPSKTPSNC